MRLSEIFIRPLVPVSRAKAQEIMRHGAVHGQPLTAKQRGLFGAIADDRPPRRPGRRRGAS